VEDLMRRIVGVAPMVALLLCLGATSQAAGVGVGHRLEIPHPIIRAGQSEPFREVVINGGPSSIQVTVFGEVVLPCGGSIDLDPLAQTVPPDGGIARWNVLFPTQAGCTGTYTVTETVEDQFGQAQDSGTFTATP